MYDDPTLERRMKALEAELEAYKQRYSDNKFELRTIRRKNEELKAELAAHKENEGDECPVCVLEAENERLTEMLGDDAIVSFVNANGGREVHRSWRDNMLRQGRRVRPELMEWDELPMYDRILDRAISLDALRDYAVWVLGHDALKEVDDVT